MSLSWRQKSVQRLTADPTKWVRLSEVFAEVERDIPPHLALRRNKADVGLNTARWRLFVSHISPLVERRACNGEKPTYRPSRMDEVRLRVEPDACKACGGPRYLSEWSNPEEGRGRGHGRKYACLTCSPPVPVVEPPVEVIEPPLAEWGVIEWVEIVEEPVVVRPVFPRPALPAPSPKPTPVTALPPPKKIRKKRKPKEKLPLVVVSPLVHKKVLPVIIAAELSAVAPAKSVQDVWEAFKFFAGDIGVYLPSIDNQTQSDRRLRSVLRKALEAGLALQFHLFRERLANELRQLDFQAGAVDNAVAEQLFLDRAEIWVPANTTSLSGLERNRWYEMICTAYRYGEMYMLQFFSQGRLEVFSSEMEVLVRKYYPQQRPKTFKDRWMSIRKQMNFKRVG